MSQTNISISTFAEIEQQFQLLALGQVSMVADWARAHSDQYPDLAAWLAGRSGADVDIPIVDTSTSLVLCGAGWQSFYKGRFSDAESCFYQGFENSLQPCDVVATLCDSSLGLARIYTRAGFWELARSWCLYALFVSRSRQRTFDTVRGYGALGDVLLRSGNISEAYACLTLAYHLQPPGRGQRSRQMNYLASALIRQDAYLRAESMLMESLSLGRDDGDPESIWHSLARLQYLYLAQGKPVDVVERFRSYLPSQERSVPCAFLYVALAGLKAGDAKSEAMSYLHRAVECFGEENPVEMSWAQWLLGVVDGNQDAKGRPPAQPLLPVKPEFRLRLHEPPPISEPVFDHSWASVNIDRKEGFSWQRNHDDSRVDLRKLVLDGRKAFFI